MEQLRILRVVVFVILGLTYNFFGAIKLTFLGWELDFIIGH